jgi:transcriptional regulator with XRE-family HTH domain
MYPKKALRPGEFEKIFGNNIRRLREKKGLSRYELAVEILGMPEEHLAKIEEGKDLLCNIEVFADIAEYLDTTINDLLP